MLAPYVALVCNVPSSRRLGGDEGLLRLIQASLASVDRHPHSPRVLKVWLQGKEVEGESEVRSMDIRSCPFPCTLCAERKTLDPP